MRQELLKFNAPTENAFQNLENGVIFCQHYSAYNDPFEFWSNIHEGIPNAAREPERFLAALAAWGFEFSSIEQATSDAGFVQEALGYFDECKDYGLPFQSMREEVRISCFASDRDNLLMWSHYADGLRGFCLAFDEGKIMDTVSEGYLAQVAYTRTPPAIDNLVYGISKDQEWYHEMAIEEQGQNPDYQDAADEAVRKMQSIWREVFATKPVEWSYERERRLLVQTSRRDTAPILHPYPREAVKEIILGERMTDDNRSRILGILKQHYPAVTVKTARRANASYGLVFD